MKSILLTITVLLFLVIYALQESHYTVAYQIRNGNHKPAYQWKGSFQHAFALRANHVTKNIPSETVQSLRSQVKNHANKSGTNLDIEWQEIGPDNISGRTRVIVIDQQVKNGSHLYSGGVSGGLFVSHNKGADWERINSFSNNLIVSCISQASNGNFYIGTGCNYEGNNTALFPGGGIYTSSDGVHFDVLESTVPQKNTTFDAWSSVNRIAIDPKHDNILYAATNAGLRVSTDAGVSWNNPLYKFCDPQPLGELTGIAFDVATAPSGRLLVATEDGLWYSDNGTEACSYTPITGDIPDIYTRVVFSIAPSDENYVYAAVTAYGQPVGVYLSKDRGESFEMITPREAIQDIFGTNPQADYNLALEVFPKNKNSVLIGGVDMARLDFGIPTQLSIWSEESDHPQYVHADKHFFEFDPFDASGKTFYVASDGGISKSVDGGNSFFTVNRNYNITQFYSVAFSNNGTVIGGTQDNGTLEIPGNHVTLGGGDYRLNTELEGIEIRGGDGFDCEISQFTPTVFASVQFLDIQRAKTGAGRLSFSEVFHCSENSTADADCIPNAEPNNFYTSIRLWESIDDLTSKDSIVFIADTVLTGISTGNGIVKTFEGVIAQVQESGTIVPGSVSFIAGADVLNDMDGDGIIEGDHGSGTINYSDGSYSISFQDPPHDGLAIEVSYAKSYGAGETLTLNSQTDPILVEHKLAGPLQVGETLKVRDPYQSLFALSVPNGVHITRQSTRFENDEVEWMHFTGATSGRPSRMEFTKDGNHLFYGTSLDAWEGQDFIPADGKVVRISGLNEVYASEDMDKANTTALYTFPNQVVTGVAINPADPETLLVTLGNYGEPNHIYMITNAISSNGPHETQVISKQGDLPAMPVFDVEIDVSDPNVVLLGTEFGVYATANIFASTVSWTDESHQMGRVPVYEIEQQKLDYTKASNHGIFYVATYGRGIWKSGSLLSIKDRLQRKQAQYAHLGIAPNPVLGNVAQLNFDLSSIVGAKEGNIRIYNIGGKLVKEMKNVALKNGRNQITMDMGKMENGSYLLNLTDANDQHIASGKAVIMK